MSASLLVLLSTGVFEGDCCIPDCCIPDPVDDDGGGAGAPFFFRSVRGELDLLPVIGVFSLL